MTSFPSSLAFERITANATDQQAAAKNALQKPTRQSGIFARVRNLFGEGHTTEKAIRSKDSIGLDQEESGWTTGDDSEDITPARTETRTSELRLKEYRFRREKGAITTVMDRGALGVHGFFKVSIAATSISVDQKAAEVICRADISYKYKPDDPRWGTESQLSTSELLQIRKGEEHIILPRLDNRRRSIRLKDCGEEPNDRAWTDIEITVSWME